MEFKNKVVVVTGAAGVFGRWITEAFWREGARVVLADARAEAAEAVVAANSIPSDRAMVQQVELTDEASIQKLAAAVEARWGVPDVVVNNAGIYPAGGLLQIDTAEFDRIFAINVRAPYAVTKAFAQQMVAAGKTRLDHHDLVRRGCRADAQGHRALLRLEDDPGADRQGLRHRVGRTGHPRECRSSRALRRAASSRPFPRITWRR